VNTTDTTTESPRLRSVRELLEHLNSLKTDGLGAQERLDFLRQAGPALIKNFDFADAFDLEAKTMAARLEQLEELSSDFEQLSQTWRTSPLAEDVREAGGNLLGHLQGFIKEGIRDERKSEIDLLSHVWGSPPDLRWLYPWMTAWTGPVYTLAEQRARRPGLSNDELTVQEAKADLERELTKANLEKVELEDDEPGKKTVMPLHSSEEIAELDRVLEKEHLAELWRLEKTWPEKVRELDEGQSSDLKADLERQARELDSGKHIRRDYEVKKDVDIGWDGNRVVAAKEPSSSQWKRGLEEGEGASSELIEEESGSSAEAPRLRQEAWTEALRAVTLEKWRFRIEAGGHLGEWGHGQAMIWKHDEESYSSARFEWAPGRPGHHNVRLFASSKKLGSREFKQEVTEAELHDLLIDPSVFVKKVLGPS